MSRSYRKNPVCIYEDPDMKFNKRRIRRNKFEKYPGRSGYKKTAGWDTQIKSVWSPERALEWYYENPYYQDKFATEKEFLDYFKKEYVCK